jgi:hypothetical protein
VSHYYLKDLKCVYYGCCGLPYGKEDQTLFINNEPNKVLQNSKWSGFFLESFRGQNIVEEQDAMVGPCISFVATLCWIAIGQYSSSSL